MSDWKTVRYDPTYEEPLDPEIIPLCDAMNAAGFVTTCSCCGHGSDWPRVWFEHGIEARIEDMARFVKKREQGPYRPFFTMFQKEILDDGYLWQLEIHLNNVYATTPVDVGLRNAVTALAEVTQAVTDWAAASPLRQEECGKTDPRLRNGIPCVKSKGHAGTHKDQTGCWW